MNTYSMLGEINLQYMILSCSDNDQIIRTL